MALRIIAPLRLDSHRLVEQLGPVSKIESQTIVLDSGRLTTDLIAKYIREYIKLRDETLHLVRLLGIERHPRNIPGTSPETVKRLDARWKELEETRSKHRELQSKMELLEKQSEDAKRKESMLRQILETGFGIEEVKTSSKGFGFTRILGRIPTRRLQDAQKTLQSSLKDQMIIATGNRKGDWTHVLVAVPSDKSTIALQTLVLNDFAQLEVPNIEQPDLKTAMAQETERVESTSDQLNDLKRNMEVFVKDASEKLNMIMDNAVESLIYLRAILRIGGGAKAEHAFTILEKAPSSKALDMLAKSGVLVETE